MCIDIDLFWIFYWLARAFDGHKIIYQKEYFIIITFKWFQLNLTFDSYKDFPQFILILLIAKNMLLYY